MLSSDRSRIGSILLANYVRVKDCFAYRRALITVLSNITSNFVIESVFVCVGVNAVLDNVLDFILYTLINLQPELKSYVSSLYQFWVIKWHKQFEIRLCLMVQSDFPA